MGRAIPYVQLHRDWLVYLIGALLCSKHEGYSVLFNVQNKLDFTLSSASFATERKENTVVPVVPFSQPT